MKPNFEQQVIDFEKNIYEPISSKCWDNGYIQELLELNNDNDKLNYLYELWEQIEKAKSKSDFLVSYFTFSVIDPERASDFESMSSELFDYRNSVKAEIGKLEEKLGIKYWREVLIRNKPKKEATSKPQPTKDEIKQKQVLQLILKTSETHLFDRSDTAIGYAISHLTAHKFSPEQIRKNISEKGAKFDLSIYDTSIEKIHKILAELQKQREALSPDK